MPLGCVSGRNARLAMIGRLASTLRFDLAVLIGAHPSILDAPDLYFLLCD